MAKITNYLHSWNPGYINSDGKYVSDGTENKIHVRIEDIDFRSSTNKLYFKIKSGWEVQIVAWVKSKKTNEDNGKEEYIKGEFINNDNITRNNEVTGDLYTFDIDVDTNHFYSMVAVNKSSDTEYNTIQPSNVKDNIIITFQEEMNVAIGSDLDMDLNTREIKDKFNEVYNGVIRNTATGTLIHLTDSANRKIKSISIYGKSTQDGTPSIESPIDIVSVVNPKLTVCKKNIFNFDDAGYNSSWNIADETYNNQPVYTNSALYSGLRMYKHSNKGTTITYSANLKVDEATAVQMWFGRSEYWDPANEKLDDISSATEYTKYTKTSTSLTSSALLEARVEKRAVNDGVLLYANSIQIEVGDTATEYEPYSGMSVELPYTLRAVKTTDVSLATYEQDGEYWIADELKINEDGTGQYIKRVESKKLGDINWIENATWNNASSNLYYAYEAASSRYSIDSQIISTVLPYNNDKVNSIYKNLTEECLIRTSDFVPYIGISKDKVTDISNLKTYLSSLNDELLVPINPITTSIPQEVVDAILNLNTYKSITNILSTQNSFQKVEYVVDTKAYIDNKFDELKSMLSVNKNIVSYVES